jgi:UDP:flavonoid glycosyltransferase YjiC (YdhE family)
VPQVVLPQWTDCYDYAQRVDMLGVGRLGNRTTKPLWSAQELSRALREVLLGKHSDAIKQRASELASLCEGRGSGQLTAARILLEQC